MNRVIHFEIPVDDGERAATFYRKALGWEIAKWEGPIDYWLADTGDEGPGIHGALTPRESPQQPTVNTIDVADVDAMVKRVEEAGGSVALPKMVVPGVGYMAYIMDTEGNLFGLMQDDPNAS